MTNIFDLVDRKLIPKEEYYKQADCKYFEHNYNMQFHFKGWGLCHHPDRTYLWCDYGWCQDQVTHDGEMPHKQEEHNTYHSWLKKWRMDMKKYYNDKRRIIVRKYK